MLLRRIRVLRCGQMQTADPVGKLTGIPERISRDSVQWMAHFGADGKQIGVYQTHVSGLLATDRASDPPRFLVGYPASWNKRKIIFQFSHNKLVVILLYRADFERFW